MEVGLLAGPLPRMGGDGDFQRSGVAVEAAVLDFLIGIPTPVGLAGNAETGVHEDHDGTAAGLEGFGDVGEESGDVRHVVDGHDAGGGIVFSIGPRTGFAGVGDDQRDAGIGGVAGSRGFYQARAGIDSGEFVDPRL